ncbi:hypothetical protein BO86DRAFT_381334 [Aspergillus japonicus CBS 114.51]|uniref:Uncharacterized protein n=2 Tax=Aspergillus TaxID=5052 RepID=A0A2V5GY58_ASPV1|nr:hypothetical protein BO86DRAFT_381334 [Aspergillus japonicus CBS 114.51]PYI16499.1 hypothetical protein BO99DRAFT_405012 [Aspergillus violaceofuscus CBS 115571]RAH79378.1 hypothetical protein BO86DRAFT_381334 [Aspergillus japonicus CBS 114.51]
MSSDDAYMSFLNKANADLDTARSNQQTSSSTSSQDRAARTETVHTGVSIPGPLTSVDAFYISETDEPFEPVALKWDGANRGVWPDASNFSNLIASSDDLAAAIETLSPASFDPRNQYASALRAVRAAASQASGGGEPGVQETDVDVKVYRVEVGSARVEYYVLALDAEGGLLVGLRAKAIES